MLIRRVQARCFAEERNCDDDPNAGTDDNQRIISGNRCEENYESCSQKESETTTRERARSVIEKYGTDSVTEGRQENENPCRRVPIRNVDLDEPVQYDSAKREQKRVSDEKFICRQ
ncbi:hypothetical protein JCM9743_21510 [Natrinema sp. JCM 9743]